MLETNDATCAGLVQGQDERQQPSHRSGERWHRQGSAVADMRWPSGSESLSDDRRDERVKQGLRWLGGYSADRTVLSSIVIVSLLALGRRTRVVSGGERGYSARFLWVLGGCRLLDKGPQYLTRGHSPHGAAEEKNRPAGFFLDQTDEW